MVKDKFCNKKKKLIFLFRVKLRIIDTVNTDLSYHEFDEPFFEIFFILNNSEILSFCNETLPSVCIIFLFFRFILMCISHILRSKVHVVIPHQFIITITIIKINLL